MLIFLYIYTYHHKFPSGYRVPKVLINSLKDCYKSLFTSLLVNIPINSDWAISSSAFLTLFYITSGASVPLPDNLTLRSSMLGGKINK